MRHLPRLIALALTAAACAPACAPERPSDRASQAPQVGEDTERARQPVALVNGEEITIGEFERRIDGLTPAARARYGTVEKRQELLDSMVIFEILADEAERKGLAEDPAVLHAMKEAMVRKMLVEELRERAPLSALDDDELRQAYQERIDEYRRPPRRRGVLLEVRTRELADEVMGQVPSAEQTSTSERVTALRRLAARHNLDPELAKKGGDTGLLPPPDQVKRDVDLARRLFEMEQRGELVGPYQHEDRWRILMLLDKRPARERSFAQVKPELRMELHEQRQAQARRQLIEELRAQADVEIRQGALADVEPPEPTGLKPPTLLDNSPPVRDLQRRGPGAEPAPDRRGAPSERDPPTEAP